MLPMKLFLPALACAFVAGGCGGTEEAEAGRAAGGGHGGGHGGGPGGGRGPGGERSDMPPVAVAVGAAELGAIASHYRASASLEPKNRAEILARVAGVVVRLLVEEGDAVTSGQPLLVIEDEEFRLRLREAEAEVARQESRFTRAREMVAGNFIAAEEFETAENDLEAARANRELAALEVEHTTVRAPFAGRITRRSVDLGQNAAPGIALFEVADFNPLLARVHVPSRELRAIDVGQRAELTLDSNEKTFTGRITLVSPVIDPTTGTIKVTIEVPNAPSARPGDFAEVRIETARHENVVLVPKDAVMNDEDGTYVYVVAADSTAEWRGVEIGFQDDRHAEIRTGLAPGEPIVVQGHRSLRPKTPLEILPKVDFARDGERRRRGPGG